MGKGKATGAAEEERRELIERCKVRNAIIFGCIVIGWVLLDQITKQFFDVQEVGATVAEPIPGVIAFKLIRNTGGAWGMLGDMTFILIALSLVICAAVIFYLFTVAPDASVPLTVGLALVFGGGVGNLIDRLTGGYVIDFIQTLFIDFPVFNIADIGVTCGVVVTMVALFAAPRSKLIAKER